MNVMEAGAWLIILGPILTGLAYGIDHKKAKFIAPKMVGFAAYVLLCFVWYGYFFQQAKNLKAVTEKA